MLVAYDTEEMDGPWSNSGLNVMVMFGEHLLSLSDDALTEMVNVRFDMAKEHAKTMLRERRANERRSNLHTVVCPDRAE